METEQSKTGKESSKHVRLKRLLAPREIKFRAWSKTTNSMIHQENHVYEYSLDYCLSVVIGFDGFAYLLREDENGKMEIVETGSMIPMQFTGLKDKKGKEIYEGDIISEGIMKDVFTVIFTDYANFGLKPLTEEIIEFSKKHNRNFEHETIDPAYAETTLEVIGNIFENPELLE